MNDYPIIVIIRDSIGETLRTKVKLSVKSPPVIKTLSTGINLLSLKKTSKLSLKTSIMDKLSAPTITSST
jgi:hypothetical protein